MFKYVGLGLAAAVALSMVNIYGNSHRNESGKSFDIVDYHRTNQKMATYYTLAAFKTCYEENTGGRFSESALRLLMGPLLSSYRFAAEQNIASMDDPRILRFREKELRKLLRGSNKIRNKRRNRKKSERLKRAEKVLASMKADYRWQNECIETKVSAFLATDERRNILINLLKP